MEKQTFQCRPLLIYRGIPEKQQEIPLIIEDNRIAVDLEVQIQGAPAFLGGDKAVALDGPVTRQSRDHCDDGATGLAGFTGAAAARLVMGVGAVQDFPGSQAEDRTGVGNVGKPEEIVVDQKDLPVLIQNGK
jgi:hypothetical protein